MRLTASWCSYSASCHWHVSEAEHSPPKYTTFRSSELRVFTFPPTSTTHPARTETTTAPTAAGTTSTAYTCPSFVSMLSTYPPALAKRMHDAENPDTFSVQVTVTVKADCCSPCGPSRVQDGAFRSRRTATACSGCCCTASEGCGLRPLSMFHTSSRRAPASAMISCPWWSVLRPVGDTKAVVLPRERMVSTSWNRLLTLLLLTAACCSCSRPPAGSYTSTVAVVEHATNTIRLPLTSISDAQPCGEPSPVPVGEILKLPTNRAVPSYTATLPLSATYSHPSPSTANAPGRLRGCPAPARLSLSVCSKLLLSSATCPSAMSDTKICPDPEQAIPPMAVNPASVRRTSPWVVTI
mmetsp:Transcript_1736/g.5035  ORF Transcript_1736/g.5035 Transcript_1736/m.5035 type:complete len:353 (-) Transcript_1736:1827-2885(-)